MGRRWRGRRCCTTSRTSPTESQSQRWGMVPGSICQVYQVSQAGQLEVYLPHQRLWRLEPRPWGHLWRVHKLWKRAPCQPKSLQPTLWPFHWPPWRGFQSKNFQSNSTWYYTYFSTRAFFCYHHTISAQLGRRGTWKSSSNGWTSYGTWSNSGN